jgi:hypothetical protein
VHTALKRTNRLRRSRWPSTPEEAQVALQKTADPDLLALWLGIASDFRIYPKLDSYDDLARWSGELRKRLHSLPEEPTEAIKAWTSVFPELEVISKALVTLRDTCRLLNERIGGGALRKNSAWQGAATWFRRNPPGTHLALALIIASRALHVGEPSARQLASIAILSGLDRPDLPEDTWNKRLAKARRWPGLELVPAFFEAIKPILESRFKKSGDVPVTPTADTAKLPPDVQTNAQHPGEAACTETTEKGASGPQLKGEDARGDKHRQ